VRDIQIRKLSLKSVFKLIAIGQYLAWIPFAILCAIGTFFGLGSIQWNGRVLEGLDALLISPVIGFIIATGITLIVGTSTAVGLWLWSKLRPLNLRFKDVDPAT
jgi:Mg/Co/Ni transporter MgtE